MNDWSPDSWIVQHNVLRLKRWIETDQNPDQRQKFERLLEIENKKLDGLLGEDSRWPSDDLERDSFWGS